jgi:hypothetical protein
MEYDDNDLDEVADDIINQCLIEEDEIDYSFNYNNNEYDYDKELEKVLQRSLEEANMYMEDENMKLEEVINMSIIEKINEYEEYEKNKELKKRNLGFLLSRLPIIIRNKDICERLLNIFNKYINNNGLYTYISESEYELFVSFMDYIYTIPIYKNIKSLIKKDDYETYMKYIVTNENGLNEDELYIISTNWIYDYSKDYIQNKIEEINKRFN